MPSALEWLAIGANLAAAAVNLWLARRCRQRLKAILELEARYRAAIVDQLAHRYYADATTSLHPRDPRKPLQH